VNPENDTGILVAHLSQTIEESRQLREDLKKGHPEGAPPQGAPLQGAPLQGATPQEEDVTSPDPPSPPG
jgi:hypothetical protein